MATGYKWADDLLTDEEELERTVEKRPVAGEPARPAWPATPSSQVAAFREKNCDRRLRSHRSVHREATTGRTFVLEIRRTPLSPTLPSDEPIHRPIQSEPDESKGAIPKTTKRGRLRSPSETTASSSRRAFFPPPPMSPQPITSAGQDSDRGTSLLPTVQRRLRFTSPSGRLLFCQEVYRGSSGRFGPSSFSCTLVDQPILRT